jgi:hypothetical protein
MGFRAFPYHREKHCLPGVEKCSSMVPMDDAALRRDSLDDYGEGDEDHITEHEEDRRNRNRTL